jgi:hypothetical protein
LRFLGQAEVLRNEHILVNTLPQSSISSNTGSMLLNSASVTFSHRDYSLRLEASLLLTKNFLEPESWETNLNANLTLTPVFRQQDQQFRLFNVHGRVATDFLSLSFNARAQLRNVPTPSNIAGLGISLLQDYSRWQETLRNYTLNTLGANLTFDATLRFVGVPITYAWGNTNILDVTHIYALGATLAPAGTLFSVTAPLIGGTTYNVWGNNSFSGRLGLLPLISPSAISQHEPAVRQFPVYGYVSAEYGRSIRGVGRLTTGIEGFINIGETVQPVPPSTNFNTLYDQYRGTSDERPPAQFNLFLRLTH